MSGIDSVPQIAVRINSDPLFELKRNIELGKVQNSAHDNRVGDFGPNRLPGYRGRWFGLFRVQYFV